MRIVFDGTAAVRQRAGIGRFARGLLHGLAEIDDQNYYALVTVGRARLRAQELRVPAHHRWLHLPVSERIARIGWHRLRVLPSPALAVPRASLFFTPDFTLPRAGRTPSILTVHDLSFIAHPECADAGLRRYLGAEVPRSLKQAAAVVAVSETTARALTAVFGVDPARIEVVPNGVDAMFIPLPEADGRAGIPPPFGLCDAYLLTVGTLEPRKNYSRLLQAFALLTKRHHRTEGVPPGASRASGPSLQLAIVGREGWQFEPIFRDVARLGLEDSVRFFTNASDSDLLTLYQRASAFVYPSLYEGFGIPPLEAMACGIPVASSTGGALPEVLGEAAVYFDPLNVQAMSEAIERVLTDDTCRHDLSERGLARAGTYTWDRAGRAALSLFRRVAA
jgi:glycosyltransferase involved in cell wall biosynthesis